MLQTKLTLREIAKRMMFHAGSFGDWLVTSFGYSSDHYHIISLRNENGNEATLSIPMYQGQIEPVSQSGIASEQYMLLSLCERGIDRPVIFNTYDEAFNEMIKDVAKQIDVPFKTLKEHIVNDTAKDLDGFNDDFSIEKHTAWVTDGINHNNYDWKIVAVTVQNNKIIKCEGE
jgi:hypothetical protein